MAKRIVGALLMSGLIAVSTSVAQASRAAAQGGNRDSDRYQKSIVGSWMATLDNGERLLFSFTSDGIDLRTVTDTPSNEGSPPAAGL